MNFGFAEPLYAIAGAVFLMATAKGRNAETRNELSIGLMLAAGTIAALPLCSLITAIRAETFDSALFALDARLGLDGSWLRALCAASPLVHFACMQAYQALGAAYAVHWAVERSRVALRAATIGAFLVVPFYLLVPACGPAYLAAGELGRFQPRNCFPSMHAVWAILLVLNAERPLHRVAFGIYAALVIVATITSGEHYAIDILAAIPFALGVQWLAARCGNLFCASAQSEEA